jgi:hypothetical protein
MRGAVFWRHSQRFLVKGYRGDAAALTTARRRGFLGIAAYQPQFDVVNVGGERLIDRLLVRS